MPCHDITLPGRRPGEPPIFGIACTRGATSRRRRCTGCGALCDRLCDVPVAGQARGGKVATCSAPVCRDCSIRFADDDVCPSHPVPDDALVAAASVR